MPFYHLVVKPYDPSLDYEAFCKKAFEDNTCLAMLEKKGGDHLHIQGFSTLDEVAFNLLQSTMLTNLHYRKSQDKNSHPVKKRKREADNVGFQYMCKELDSSVVVYKQGLTDSDLKEFHAASDAHREELKSQLGEYVVGSVNIGDAPSPQKLHKRVCRAAVKYYLAEEKMHPPNLKLLCRHILVSKYGTEEVINYVADMLM